jgi:hypothetical protein
MTNPKSDARISKPLEVAIRISKATTKNASFRTMSESGCAWVQREIAAEDDCPAAGVGEVLTCF